MGHGIVKLIDDNYVEWSTVVDAPITYCKSREAAIIAFGIDRVDRCDVNGHSYLDRDNSEHAAFNRAGPNECCLTKEAIARRFKNESCYNSFKLEPRDIRPHLSLYPDGKSYWLPWKPGNEPLSLTVENLSGRELAHIHN